MSESMVLAPGPALDAKAFVLSMSGEVLAFLGVVGVVCLVLAFLREMGR